MDGDAKANLRMDINKNSLKESGLSIEELMELAKENTYCFYKPFVMPLYDYIKDHMIKDMRRCRNACRALRTELSQILSLQQYNRGG